MESSDDELDERLEMLPTHSAAWKPNVHSQTKPFNRCCTTRRGISLLLLSAAGIFAIAYFFWPGIAWPPPPPIVPPKDISSAIHDPIWSNRSLSVKEAFLHAYGGYEKYTTFPDDELKPVSNSGQRK
jgi:hypothetical protein